MLKKGKQNNISQAGSLVSYWDRKELGIFGSELAAFVGIIKQSISEAVTRGERLVNEKGHYLTS